MCCFMKASISLLIFSLKFVSLCIFSVFDDEAKHSEETDREIPRWQLLLILVRVACKM